MEDDFFQLPPNDDCLNFHQRLRRTECERCSRAFACLLVRASLVGTDAQPKLDGSRLRFPNGTESVDAVNQTRAEAELVPCPDCGWVNQEAIERYQSGRLRNLTTLAKSIGVGSLVVVAYLILITVNGAIQKPRDIEFVRTVAAWVAASGVLVAASLVWLRRWRLGLIDPNRRFPSESQVPPGTPAALIAGDDGACKVTREAIPLIIEPDRLAFRLGWDVLPSHCCVCFAETPDSVLPIDTSFGTLFAAACGLCRKRTRKRLAIAKMAWTLTIVVLTGGVTNLWTQSVDEAIPHFVIGVVILYSTTSHIIRLQFDPIACSSQFLSRGVLLISFKNCDYHDRYVELISSAYFGQQQFLEHPEPE